MVGIRNIGLVIIGAMLTAVAAVPALAEYPERPVTIVAPYGPGGSSDVIGRILAERLTVELGGNFLVENRPGAGSRVGTEFVARAQPDGYTLLLADMPFSIIPKLYKDAKYDVQDFVAITQIGVAPMFLYARPDFEGDTISAVLDAAKAEPKALLIGSGGIGATTHMMAELFQREGKVELLHVPFGGAGPALQGLAGGQVDVAFSTIATGKPLLDAGSMKAIGVTSAKRVDSYPDVETFAEAGYDLEVEHWWGLLAPAGTPADVVERLRKAATGVLKQAEVQARLGQLTVQPPRLTPEEFQAFTVSESERWADIIKSAGITVDQ